MTSNIQNLRDSPEWKEFKRACEQGDVHKVKAMIDGGLDPSADRNFGTVYLDGIRLFMKAIIEASESGHSEVVKILLVDSRVDPCDQEFKGNSSCNSTRHS